MELLTWGHGAVINWIPVGSVSHPDYWYMNFTDLVLMIGLPAMIHLLANATGYVRGSFQRKFKIPLWRVLTGIVSVAVGGLVSVISAYPESSLWDFSNFALGAVFALAGVLISSAVMWLLRPIEKIAEASEATGLRGAGVIVTPSPPILPNQPEAGQNPAPMLAALGAPADFFLRGAPSLRLGTLEASEMRGATEVMEEKSQSPPQALSHQSVLESYRSIEAKSPQNLEALDPSRRNSLFFSTYNNKIASLKSLPIYDPKGIIGFCFGRAMAAHLLARMMGLKPESIRKLFILGDLRADGKTAWRFHVTTVVKGTNGRWYAIDPVLPRPLEINEWIKTIRSIWDKQGKARLYITHAGAVLPDARNVPEINQEKGEHIVEISFDPKGKPGFKAADPAFNLSPEIAPDVFELDSVKSAGNHFMDPEDRSPARFNFVSITINGETIGYNGYFKDLLDSLIYPSVSEPAQLLSGLEMTFEMTSRMMRQTHDLGSMRFDLFGDEKMRAEQWQTGSFASAVDGAELKYQYRLPDGAPGRSPTVFVGGWALSDSFSSLFETQENAPNPQFALWPRGQPPSPWARTREVFDADARDLAQMIVKAAESSGAERAARASVSDRTWTGPPASKTGAGPDSVPEARRVPPELQSSLVSDQGLRSGVNLVLHSYSNLVLQRMLQLDRYPEVRRALELLRGGKLTFVNAVTHTGTSEKLFGEENIQTAKNVRAFISWLNLMDISAQMWKKYALLNPFLAPTIYASLAVWQAQRQSALAMAVKDGINMLRRDLKEPWEPRIDHVRQELLKKFDGMADDPGWHEGMMRRANDTSLFDFTSKEVEKLRQMGVKIDVIHSHGDKLVTWASAKLLLDFLGIRAPDKVPAAGTTLKDESGNWRAIIVDGDHYYPLKEPEELEKILNRP
ncbi:MAG: hypothetical protein HY747_07810 [Elusimicrobia bacterium]|nr:hypothetical protein [Elusimicrobiota bacterium]